MADSREWYVLEPDNTGSEYTNLETADRAAQTLAAGGAVTDAVTILRCTSTPVRRYRRETKVVSEEINPLA
ncbi:hypothetical protein ACWC1C_01325 [Streptomyces sp. NPDC001705]